MPAKGCPNCPGAPMTAAVRGVARNDGHDACEEGRCASAYGDTNKGAQKPSKQTICHLTAARVQWLTSLSHSLSLVPLRRCSIKPRRTLLQPSVLQPRLFFCAVHMIVIPGWTPASVAMTLSCGSVEARYKKQYAYDGHTAAVGVRLPTHRTRFTVVPPQVPHSYRA